MAYHQVDFYKHFHKSQEVGIVEPATPATMEKLNKVLSTIPTDRRESLERYYKVKERGYWGELSANNCIKKLGGK